MSRFEPLITDIYDAVAASPEASIKLPTDVNWLDFGLPPAPEEVAAFPVIRIDGLYLGDDRLNSYPLLLKLWAVDDGQHLAFLDLAEAVNAALSTKSKLFNTNGYVIRHEPQSQLFCAVFDVTAYLR